MMMNKLHCVIPFLFLLLIPLITSSQNIKLSLSEVRFEHIRINVPDKEATAKWYVENVGLEIIPTSDNRYVYLADKDHNCMLELSSIAGIRDTYHDIDIDGFHLAFEGQKSIKDVAEKMLANGGVEVGELYTNLIGDYVRNVRDPNGFVSQLIYRVNPFLSKPINGAIRFEHFAYNTPDQKIAALWYVEFMKLIIPWSKDIDKSTLNRNYRIPYVGDAQNNMSMELMGKEMECSLSNQPHEVIHIAFLTGQPEKVTERLIDGGATKIGETRKENNGDIVIDLYSPIRIPIRLIKRNVQILK
jgi:catechol 2,3-dioxygenase-like lactoylglutathione lyase family enzyme